MALLEVSDLNVSYGPIQAVRHVSCEVAAGELVSIIGANGAGKTSFLMALSGLTPSTSASLKLDGEDLRSRRADARVHSGLCQVPEGRRLFGPLSVEENLRLGTYASRRRHTAADLAESLDKVYTLFPRLAERRRQKAGTMSGGEQQMAAIGRALMSRPRVLLLDEPALGLAPKIVRQIFDALVALNQDGLTVLCVEQNAALALEVSDRCYLFQLGEVAMTGRSSEMRNDPRIADVYLGGGG